MLHASCWGFWRTVRWLLISLLVLLVGAIADSIERYWASDWVPHPQDVTSDDGDVPKINLLGNRTPAEEAISAELRSHRAQPRFSQLRSAGACTPSAPFLTTAPW